MGLTRGNQMQEARVANMKEEEPQVTLRRSNSKGGGSPGVDSPFQRAPRPNSQPPGSSESAQSRRSVREIRRSFEAGTSVGAAEPGNLVKQIPSARRSFHFERGPSSWETAGFGRRKLSSNGEGASACSPVPELERREDRSREFAGHSRIPIRGKEERIQAVDEACETREAKRENCQNIDNGAQQMQQRSNKSERGGTIITQQSVSFASVTVESQFTQQVSSQDANATGALRKNHLTEKPSGAESVSPYLGAHGGVEGEGRHSSQMSSPEDRGGDHSYDDGKVDRKLKKTSDISRSPNKTNGLENEDIHSQLESSSAQKDSLSLIEAAESLEKSKSQIDRLQSNLLPLSCETVNSLQSKLPYSKPSVSFVPKAMPIPKSTSAPATMTSELNSKEKNQDVPAESDTGQQSASAQNQRVLHPPTSKKANESCRAQEELDKERQRKEDMSKRIEGDPLASQTKEHSTELFMDSKSKLRAQFFETDVKTEVIKNQEQVTTLSEPTSSSSVATESCQDQAFQTISGAVTSNKSSAENATRKATPPKDLALHVTSYPSAIEQSQKIAVKPLKNGEEMISNTEWLKGTITVESTQKTYMMVDKSMTVASFKQSGNAQEQEPQSMPPTAPRVVGVEAKKGVEIPDKVSSPIHPQRQTGIPVLAERKRIPENANIKSDAAQSPDDTSKSTKSNESVPVGVSSPDAEEYRAFLLCARREERFANESEMSCTLPENGIGMRASLPPKTIDAEKHSRQKDHISACIDINANERNDNLSGSSDASKRTKNEVLEGIENGECAENGDSLEDKGSKSNKQTAGNHSAGKDIVEGEGQISSTKESPKGKKIGFMMAVLGGLKDSNKKKKSPPKEAPSQQKPKREIKKRRGRVGPPLTEEEIRELEEEAERKRKQMEERRALEAKVRQEATANAPIPQPTGKDGEIAEKRKSSNDFLFDLEENLLNMDEDDRSDVRRDAYADLLKKLVKAEAKKDVEGAREDSSSKKTDQGDDSDGSDTAVEEGEDGEYDYEDVVELRSKPGRRIQDRDQTTDYEWQEIEVVKPAAPVPSVRTTSLTSRSVSKSGPKSPTIMVETVSPTSTVALTSSPLTLSPGGSRTGSDSDISGPRRRTMIETAFIGSDTLSSGNYASTSSVDERQSASSRLLRTPSPQVPLGQSRIPHTSLVLEERLRRRSTSADRDKRRAVSLSPTPTDSPVNRNRGGGNSSYSGDDVTDGDVHSPEGIFEHVDRHRPLKQSMKPKEVEKKLPPKTFLQRLLGQSSPTSPVEKTAQPHSHRSGSPRRQNPPRACMAYANTATAKPPLFAQCRDPRVASLPPGVSPPPRTPAENRMRSMSPPTTPSEYQAMQMYYQRQSLEYGSGGIAPGGRRVQSPPPTLTADRATMGVRPQPVHSNTMGALYGSSQSMPGRTPDPRARSLSPHDAYGGKGGGANYFVRGAPARTTIATTGERSRISSERSGSTSTLPVPIFKRGTILASSEDSVCSAPAAPKRVSFSSSTPTKAEREHMRMLQLREWQQRAMSTGGSMYGDDDVFSAPNKPLPPTPSAEELEEEERRWLRGAMAVGARTPMKFLEVSPTAVSESESGSEAGEVRRIMQRRRAKGKALLSDHYHRVGWVEVGPRFLRLSEDVFVSASPLGLSSCLELLLLLLSSPAATSTTDTSSSASQPHNRTLMFS
ncbi:uncharacterized protein LOC124164480 [Ischnura elegans]|uniref:uncharacterized protein LOC124164480 n=1 Tax=Ischnura elegans TaxID=197161 RepID=UPI001ED8896E|nr:uncharacterized protein LOC124164480 [Ischnura elegans]